MSRETVFDNMEAGFPSLRDSSGARRPSFDRDQLN